ncbi:MAG: biotin--[acetyl-CoA-carboxylase] ligase [Saccharospirillum sp.]
MKSLYRLLPLLAHEQYQSGQKLADQLGVTRPTISNWVAELQQLGIDVYTVKGRGYRLAEPISLLDRQAVLGALPASLAQKMAVFDVCPDLDSTNRWVMEQQAEPGRWAVCTADYQHQGRGRRGRPWRSPPASSVMVSIAVREALPVRALYSASLIVGVAVARAVTATTGTELALKWPNDLYHQNQKLGGILCEMQGNPQDQPVLVFGIGLNVNKTPQGVDQPATCLARLTGALVDRNALLIALLIELDAVLSELRTYAGLANLLAEWRRYDCIRDREIVLVQGDRKTPCVACGIDENGQLQVREASGKTYSVNGGEVSVRW